MDDLTTPVSADPAAVPLKLLKRYLRANDWRQVTPRAKEHVIPERLAGLAASFMGTPIQRSAFEVFTRSKPGRPEVKLVLPAVDAQTNEALRQVETVITTLATLERRSPQNVIAAIRARGFDRISSRIPDGLVIDNSIHLEIAAAHITGMKSLLAATATTEMRPNAYFLRTLPAAVKYADNCRFGHTFKGSFGFTIESPLEINDTPTFEVVAETPPFERRVVQRFERGVQAVIEAARLGDTAPITESSETAFSANACEIFANLVENTSPGGMDFEFDLSPEWRAPGGLGHRVFSVSSEHIDITRSAAKLMREKPVAREETIIGRVTDLHSNDPLDLLSGNSNNSIVVLWNSEDLGEIPVLMALSPPDYLTAVDAHKAGKAVKASGTLEQKGRGRWVLSYVSDFSLNTQDAE